MEVSLNRARRYLLALLAVTCGLLAVAGTASARGLLYGADGAGGHLSNLYVLDQDTGAVVKTVGPIGFAVTGLALDPTTGVLYGSTGGGRDRGAGQPDPGSLITVNRTTGTGTLVGDLRPDTETAADLTFTPDGALFGWLEPNTDDLVSIDKKTGAAKVVGDSGLSTAGSGIAANSVGVIYLAGESDAGPLDTIDRATGAATPGPTLSGTDERQIAALAFDDANRLFGARTHVALQNSDASDLITIDTRSGAIASLGPSIGRLDAIVFAPSRKVVLAKKLTDGGTRVRLFGQINDAADPVCRGRQPVQIQRKKLGAARSANVDDLIADSGAALPVEKRRFRVFRKLTSNRRGTFSTKAKVTRGFKYRAVLPESNACGDATSKAHQVKA